MSSGKIADAVIGIGLAFVAAYLFVVLVGVVNATLERRWPTADLLDLFIGGPIFVLAFTFWLVLPSGAILGAWIPAIVKNKPGAMAVLYGVIFGFVIGLAFAAVAAYVMANVATISSDGPPDVAKWWLTFWKELTHLGPFTIPYSCTCTGLYAFLRSNRRKGSADPLLSS